MTEDEIYYKNQLKCQSETIDKLKEVNNSLYEKIKKLKKQYCERTDCSGRIGASKKVEELQEENKKLKEDVGKFVNDINELQKELNKENLECSKYVKLLTETEEQVKKQEEVINEVVLELVNIDGDLSNSQLSDRICNVIDILKGVSE